MWLKTGVLDGFERCCLRVGLAIYRGGCNSSLIAGVHSGLL